MSSRSRTRLARPRTGRTPPRLAGVAAAVVLCFAVLAGPAAGGYPERHSTVNDFAGVLGPGEEAAIRDLLSDFRADPGIEAVVVTVRSTRDYDTGDRSIESFATHLFNTWGIGSRDRNDGVLFLVAVRDRQVRIEVGSGYGPDQNPMMKAIIDGRMLPRFRHGDYAGGLRAGVAAVREALAGARAPQADAPWSAAALPAEAPASTSPKAENPSSPARDSVPPSTVGWYLAAGAGLLTLLAPLYLLLRPRRCPDCRTKIRRLDELTEDEFLDADQQLEENLGSVNYDVWHCDGCGKQVVARRRRWFSSYDACPKCGVSAFESRRDIVEPPTPYSTGKMLVTRTCYACDFREEFRETLPMLTTPSASHSSSGSGGGGGGGHSSGGGASGSW